MEEQEEIKKPTKQELIYMLDEMIKNIENLPMGAMLQPITHYDHCALLLWLSAFVKDWTDD